MFNFKKRYAGMILSLVVAGGAGMAAADDFAPPGYRGKPLSIEAEWEFLFTPNFNAGEPPSFFNAVPGLGGETLYPGFATHIDFDSPNNWLWSPTLPGDNDGGITPSIIGSANGASFGINLQNWVDQEPVKYIRVQLTWQGDLPPVILTDGIVAEELTPGPAPIVFEVREIGREVIDRNHFYVDFAIFPNPAWEQIPVFVPFGTVVDEIYVDTISVPEPTTLGLFLLGGLACCRRRNLAGLASGR